MPLRASSPTRPPPPLPPPVSADAVTRLHWCGKKQLSTNSSAAYLMRIWSLSESSRLEVQTLDKLALFLGGWQPAQSPGLPTNYQSVVAGQPAAALIRPLLEDLLQEESYLELRQATTNQPRVKPPWPSSSVSRAGGAMADSRWQPTLPRRQTVPGGPRWRVDPSGLGVGGRARHQRPPGRTGDSIPKPESGATLRFGHALW